MRVWNRTGDTVWIARGRGIPVGGSADLTPAETALVRDALLQGHLADHPAPVAEGETPVPAPLPPAQARRKGRR